jgi:hypothetical protein
MVSKISQSVYDQVYARLSDQAGGLNATFMANAANYNVDPNFVSIDFSPGSTTFFHGQVDFDDYDKSGLVRYPAACLYILESLNSNLEKFHKFSGPVRCIFEVTLSWGQIRGGVNFEKYSNCLEDAVVDVINRLSNQNWQPPVSYNGQIQSKRGPIGFGAGNFKQKVGFSMMFAVDTQDL